MATSLSGECSLEYRYHVYTLLFGMKKFIYIVKEYNRIFKKFSNESKRIKNNKFKNDSDDDSEAACTVPL